MSHLHVQQLILIRSEFTVAHVAARELASVWPRWASSPEMAGISFLDAQRTVANLEITYVVRLFSEFEAILQDHLHLHYPRERLPGRAEGLINRAAARRRVRNEIRDGAHGVREFRNSIVHHRVTGGPTLDFQQSLTALNRFVAPLPD